MVWYGIVEFNVPLETYNKAMKVALVNSTKHTQPRNLDKSEDK